MAERGNALQLSGTFVLSHRCALIHAEAARVLATYGDDFYRGRPALTVNDVGRGRAFYLAADAEDRFLSAFYARLFADGRPDSGRLAEAAPARAPVEDLPEGVLAQVRTDASHRYLFLMNFAARGASVRLSGHGWTRLPGGGPTQPTVSLEPYGFAILRGSTGG